MTSAVLQTGRRQQHTVTPRLQHAVRLLQLSSLDFAQEVHDAMGKNPFLEVEDGADPAQANDEPPDPTQVRIAAADSNDGSEGEGDAPYERENWQHASLGARADGGESDIGALDLVAAQIGLRPHLRSQINVLPLSRRDHVLACTVIESLDDDGYLRTDLVELAGLSDLEPAVDAPEMQIALRLVQSLDPCGVGARSVSECLQLQLGCIDDPGERELARRIVSEHLQRLAQHDVNALVKALGSTPAHIEAVCGRIRRFDPRPGWRLGASDVHFVTPDVVVKKVRGKWTAAVNRAVIPRVKLNQTYASLFQEHRESRHSELAAHLQEARWTVRNVQQRFSTILLVAEAILKRQQHFLDFGPMAMKPLGLREIAEELGLHESTVSRVTNNKYMATPTGVFELKYFFSREMTTASGGACSATAIRGVIKEMIEAENAIEPLSDAQIARLLVRQGLKVARRTVTKYRQLLKLAPVERRRKVVCAAVASGARSAHAPG